MGKTLQICNYGDFYTVSNGIYTVEGDEHIGYGIQGNGISFADISVNFSAVQKLVSMCNDLKLDSVHLYDVVEDFVCAG